MMYQRSWEPGGRDPVPPACSYWELSTASSSRAGAGCGAFSSWVPPGGKTKKIQCLDCSPSCPAQTSTLVMDHHHPALHSWIKVYSKPDTSTHQTQKRIVLWNIYSETHISIHIYMCTYCLLLWGPQNLSHFGLRCRFDVGKISSDSVREHIPIYAY